MKFTLSWLKEHLDTQASAQDVADALNSIGFEVEGVVDHAKTLAPFVVAHILEAEQHPNADRLRVCKVDFGGNDPIQVVCGAPNARKGLKTVFAATGMTVPGNGLKLKASAIRGVDSNGMLCSAEEMGIAGDASGILELPDTAIVGEPFAPFLNLDDAVIEISVTPNRGDALGVRAIARELAAKGLGTLIDKPIVPIVARFQTDLKLTLDLQNRDAHCPGFALRVIRGVRNVPSPAWLKQKLEAIGLRSINALVDVTNFLSYDRARPLHVFDADKVSQNLIVRLAKSNESLLALDGKTYTFDENMCVISDGNTVVSVAGIMGGEDSGCTQSTTNVIIESALWNALNIAQTGRKLGIHSDARQRFERGVDPNFMIDGLELASQLILDMCGGEPSQVVCEAPMLAKPSAISFPLSEVKRLSGLEVEANRAQNILLSLGFEVSGSGDVLVCTPPSWRYDVSQKADLVEEVVRIIGLDDLPSQPLPKSQTIGAAILTPAQIRLRTTRRAMAANGFLEAITWSFLSESDTELFLQNGAVLRLENPISADLACMRPSLLPGLLRAADMNAKRGYGDLSLFEVGQVFHGFTPQDQFFAATTVRRGQSQSIGSGRHWRQNAQFCDVFDAKADALATLEAAGFSSDKVQIAQGGAPYLHPGRSGTLKLGNKVLGRFGELHPKILKAMDISGSFAVSEVILDHLPLPKAKAIKTKPMLAISALQPLKRDLAFLLSKSVNVSDVVRTIKGVEKALITDVIVFDVYEGKGVAEGFVSVAFGLELSPIESSLKDTEIDALLKGVVEAVTQQFEASLRN